MGIGGRNDKFRFTELLEVCTQALASPSGRGTSRREGERDVQTVRAGLRFRMGELVRWVCGWFWGGIGAVSPLRRFAPALPEGEPRAWWVSLDGGIAKGAVGIDGQSDKFRFIGQTEGMVAAKAPLCKGSCQRS